MTSTASADRRPAAVAWYRSYQAQRKVRTLAGVRILRAFERTYPNAFFVQVGSNDGEQHDPLRAAILRSRWRGIMIEPVPFVFERLRRNYGVYADRIALENVAIGDHNGPVPFFHLAPVGDYESEGLPQWYDGIGSFHRDHVLKHIEYIPDIESRVVETAVPALTFGSLCDRYGVEHIDLVHIDAEGSDADVVRSIDLERHRPRVLIYEHYHLDAEEQANCRQHLAAFGYRTLEHGMDTWALSSDPAGPNERRLFEVWDLAERDAGGSDDSSAVRRILARQPHVRRLARKGWHFLKRYAEPRRRQEIEAWIDVMVEHTTPAELRMLTQAYDDEVPLPADASKLTSSHPRLKELRDAYAHLDLPVSVPSVWNDGLLGRDLDLRYFRGENPYVWHYREWPRAMMLKYFVFLEYVRGRDEAGLLSRLDEDGAFGCWTFSYPGHPRVSRDLLDSVNEILFLDRQLDVLARRHLRVLDIGAGYGRSAHRMSTAIAGLDDYCCVDAVPESTFLCEYYLRHRGVAPARVVPLHEIDRALAVDHFDLAVNIHSFSECTYDAVAWWLDRLASLRVPNLLIVPNDRDELLAFETDGTRRDFRPLVEAAGYTLAASEPVIDDPAVRELMRVPDQFLLFERTR